MKQFIGALMIAGLFMACSISEYLPDLVGTEAQVTYSQSEIETIYGIADNIVVYINLPPAYNASGAPLPAAFILDGDSTYENGAGINSELIETFETSGAIIFAVGYGYSDAYQRNPLSDSPSGRWRDFVFPESGDYFTGEPTGEENTNPDGYYQFLKEKLVPDMKSQYNIDEQRVALIGHSLGGDFTYYAFTRHDPDSLNVSGVDNPFSYYVPIDGVQEDYLQDVYEAQQKSVMSLNANSFVEDVHLYLIHGYLTSPPAVLIMESIILKYQTYNYTNLTLNRYYPYNDDHADSLNTGIRNGLQLLLGIPSYKKVNDEGGYSL